MTSTIELDRPARNGRPGRRRRWLIRLGVAAAAVATAAAAGAVYVATHAGNTPLPDGEHPVQVYTVNDSISTVVPPAERPGVIGRFIGMCDADTYYVEVDGTGWCLVLNGPLGTVRARGTGHGAELDAGQAAIARDLARDSGDPEPATRVLLAHDGGWAGLVRVADLDAGGPVRAAAVS